MSEMSPQLHDVVWTTSKIARFWNQYAELAEQKYSYFSKTIGPSLLRLVRRQGVSLNGRVLDFGCGPGFLLEFLSKHSHFYRGVDFSAVSVEAALHRLYGRRGFAGVSLVETLPTELEAEQFDLVFLVETLEHLLPEQRDATLREIRRLLRPGGTLVVTVPNEENLAQSKIACPDCGCVFHRMQHISTWSAKSISAELSGHGFQARMCRGKRLAASGFVGAGVNLAHLLVGGAPPNLVYIGHKK
jgi:SAM-dependent methyltransferase